MNHSGFKIVYQHYLEAKEVYPRLFEPVVSNNKVIIDGTVDIIDRDKTNWATYEVRIVIPEQYPFRVPSLFETGGQIIKSPDWHVYSDGSCCLAPPAKMYKELSDGITLNKWLSKLVIPFLANHHLKTKTGQYANIEYSHGKEGIREYYRKWFGTDDDSEILRKAMYITKMTAYGRNDKCFCGSGKKYKCCHWNMKEYQGVPIEIIKEDFFYLK